MFLPLMSFNDSPTPSFSHLLITGCYRSGTTLLEKLLHQHEKICLASQPFPILYFYVKSVFYDRIGIKRRYPLDHLFLEDGYQAGQFYGFLNQFRLSEQDLQRVFDQMAEYTLGLWTPEMLQFRDQVVPGTFIDVYHQLNSFVAQLFPKAHTRYVGGKEVLCEEYVPYILSKGGKAIIIIRDPRDMITSLNFRERDNLTGSHRPILYSLRAWRKSVAVALACAEQPDFLWLRYEDLVEDSIAVLNCIVAPWRLSEFSPNMFRDGIYDQWGELWRGNSSFKDQVGVSTSSLGKFVDVLPQDTVAYIEACCWPEMRLLGYDFRHQTRFAADAVQSYQEPFEINHPKFPSDYSFSVDHVEEEIERHQKLLEPSVSLDTQKRWFLFPQTYEKLRSTMV